MDFTSQAEYFAEKSDEELALIDGNKTLDAQTQRVLQEELRRRRQRVGAQFSHGSGPRVHESLPMQVHIVDINMPMGSMVEFMLKWAIASIPAFIILTLIFATLFAVVGGVIGGLDSYRTRLP